ncbi:MAG: Transcriptional activator MetR [Candidatus Acidoferrum typicum]|jgi:LysR family transcriptional regulator for metE and metH|nr:Transcriptional activator MetR [Candidatus Acidoferrum typicum]
MHLEMRHLKLVAAIAETGSVTLAGNRLHLTQSALSHQLRDAEEQLGVPLFERRNRRMALTAAGERLLQSARAVIDELARAEKEIRECNGNGASKGVLRLSTECCTVYHWLPPRLRLFQHKFPAVDFQLVIEATDSPFEALLEGKLDLAIVCDPIRNRRIRYTPLFEDEVVMIVPPEHRLAGKTFAAPLEFAEENLIIYPPKEDSTVLNRFLIPAGITPRKIHEVTLTEVIIEMVRGGLGVAALAKWAVAPHLDSGALVGLSLTEQGFRRTWSAAQVRDRRTPAYVEEFIRVLAEHPIPECIRPRKMTMRKRAAA